MKTGVISQGVYVNRKPTLSFTYGNYLEQKRNPKVGERANLVLRTTGYIGTNPISIPEEQARAEFKRGMLKLSDAVEDFEYNKSPVLKPLKNLDVRGPYTVRELEPARIQKIIYHGREIFFGITKQNHLVMYSIAEEKGKRQMIIHAVESVYKYQNSTAYLKNKARQTLLELIRKHYDTHEVVTPFVLVKEAA